MYNKFFILCILLLSVVACKKKKPCKVYNYSANAHYIGSQNINNIKAIATVTDEDTGISIKVEMTGTDKTLEYPVHIHMQDLSEPFGYSGNPVIGISHVHNGMPTSTITSKYLFETFTKNFKGYLVIHDPNNVVNDTLTHVVYGKIGSW